MKKAMVICLLFNFAVVTAFAFNEGFILGLKSYFSGSLTDPHISRQDLDMMKASYLKGNVGFIMHGGVDLTYIFDSKKYFKFENNNIFGGLGLSGYVEIGQGFSGQISGNEASKLDVFINVFFTPVVHFGSSLKTYLLNNRLILGGALGGRLIADPTPMYDQYSSDPKTIGPDVGTIIVTKEMMKKMNPWGFELKGFIEYVQPVLQTMELVLGGYMAYCVYKPGYISMPPQLEALSKSAGFDPAATKLNSFYLNSLDFGVSIGLNFKVKP